MEYQYTMSAAPRVYPPPNSPAVEAAFQAAPRTLVVEILNGQLRVSPRPAPRHANAAGELLGELRGPFRLGRGGPGGWIFLPEPELHLGTRPDKLVPDLAGWLRERVEPQTFEGKAVALVPDWICEVLSPSTEEEDRGEKMPIYAREGVRHAWLIDPGEQALEVYRLERGALRQIATHRRDARVRAEPFEAYELSLDALWTW